MADQNIKPLLPIVRTGDVLKKKKVPGKKPPEHIPESVKKQKGQRKGIIDTYA